jgi:hypothetical protein
MIQGTNQFSQRGECAQTVSAPSTVPSTKEISVAVPINPIVHGSACSSIVETRVG